MILRFKRLRDGAELPAYATGGSVGLDVKACLEEPVVLLPHSGAVIGTGLSCELPDGWEIQVRSRSGLAVKDNVFVLNSPGTVDSDYRGEIKVVLFNLGEREFHVQNGMRIAQLVAGPYPRMVVMEVENIDDTERGTGGFGSTGT